MTIGPGQDLLHYRLVEKIGEGGMGVVWKAVDETLHRDVAIKVLPDLLSSEPERLARFEREAKLLASLNHPNIAGIYGFHKSDEKPFLVMELVEGEDLSQRLSRGALPRRETLDVALQIAKAFEAAHEASVVHRDLKPANVKLTSGGKVKVLDFGLAKAFLSDPSGPQANPAMSPTLTSAGSVAGIVLGTASYMSPEQAKGKQVDRRADIWAFGVVLFEMLTGRKLFEGETISETLAAVIMKDVDWGALPADTPRAIRRLLERCLQRDPDSRLRDIGEARIAIEEALRTPVKEVSAAAGSEATRRPAWLTILPWGVAVAAVALLSWVWFSGNRNSLHSPVMRFTMAIAEDQPLDAAPVPVLAISPDGTRIAYVGISGNDEMIFLRHIHQHEAVPLAGTEGADSPFFSPDGEWIGFEAGDKLKKISVLGGPPMTLCDAPRLRGASWGADGTIVFAPNRSGGLMRVSEAGGEPERLTRDDEIEDRIGVPSDRWPDLLPDGRTVIYTSTETNNNYTDAEIVALSLEDGSRKTLVKGGNFGRFVPPGFLVYARQNTFFAVRFDPRRLEVIGSAVPVLEGIESVASYGSSQLAFSNNGTLLYLGGSASFEQENLVWIDRDGTEELASAQERDFGYASVSPDGRYVALEVISNTEDQADVWILELARDTLTRLTFHEARDVDPIWTPDGEWIVFSSARDGGTYNLYRKRANGTGEVERLTTSENRQHAGHWSPDGRMLAITEISADNGPDIMLYRPGSDPEVEAFVATPYEEWGPQISPDGRWLAYTSDASGEYEIYVRAISGSGEQVRVSTDGGVVAKWSPDGKELLYRSFSAKMMAVSFSVEEDRFRPALPRELFNYPAPPHSWFYDIAPDGQRVLSYKDVVGGATSRREPVVVINWIDELESMVPAAR